MAGPFDPGPPQWNPSTEIHPGGPHPGMVHRMELMHDEELLREKERKGNSEDDFSFS